MATASLEAPRRPQISLSENPISTSGPSDEPPITSEKHAQWQRKESQILAQLNETLEIVEENFEKTHDRMQNEIDALKGIVVNINALITVGAFIAGVQAQMISFTWESNNNSLQRTANWFSFAGLTLDIIGTAIGVIRTGSLQRSVRRTERVLNAVSGDLYRLQTRLNRLAARTASSADRSARSALLSDIERLMDELAHHLKIFDEFVKYWELSLPMVGADNPLYTTESDAEMAWKPMEFLITLGGLLGLPQTVPGQVPIVVMSGGIIFLLLSVILFAASSQPHAVWIACVILAAVALIWSESLATFDLQRREKKRLHMKIEEMLGAPRGQYTSTHEVDPLPLDTQSLP
ncbi:hypothetical protein HGRIS_014019 [Hohenbuehelia grisea]|uniref:Uncharacterized protein n=1 Tax=Hohenbuehelia grisea TaxID=104357 RepID=A0ABR3JTS1_9AGAR